MLNNVTHRDLRVITRYGAAFGDEVGTVAVPVEKLKRSIEDKT